MARKRQRPEVEAAAKRLGMDASVVAAAYEDFWAGIRAFLIDAHETGLDPRKPAGRVYIKGIGNMWCKPGPPCTKIIRKRKRYER